MNGPLDRKYQPISNAFKQGFVALCAEYLPIPLVHQ